jgi:hypothetical protein
MELRPSGFGRSRAHGARRGLIAAALALGAIAPAPAQAVRPGEPAVTKPPAVPERGARRLFQRFVQDAAVTPGGWIEAQYRYSNLPGGSRHQAGPLVAFKLVDNLEAGLQFGYVDANPDAGPGGSGLSDIDVYVKYRLPGGRARLALGTLLKVATAEEAEGLGTGKADLELFTAFRADLEAVTLTWNAGLRLNGNADPPAPETDNSIVLGAAILMPATQRLTFVIEGTYETERFEGAGSDGRLTVGLQSLGPARRGGFRAAVGIPLTDGAPDHEILAGAFLTY